jgi:predicted transcriptional regulator
MRRGRRRSCAEGLPPLGDLELAVLEHLWQAGETDVAEAHHALGRRISPNTVGSALERLHRKGLAARRKVSHAYRYRPLLERETFTARRAVDAAGGPSAVTDLGVLAAFLDELTVADADVLDHLESLIARRRAKDGR